MMRATRRGQRRILEATAIASIVSGAPSTASALRGGSPREAITAGLHATRAIGMIVPPGRPGLVRGAAGHLIISFAVGEMLGAALPRERSLLWGALAGLAIGWVNLGVIAPRHFPELAALPLGPQLADNAAFGAVFAAVADRRG